MSKNKTIDDLREGLFDAMQMLKAGKLTVEQAKAYSELGQVVINSAKVETDYVKATGGAVTIPFLEKPVEKRVEDQPLPPGVVSVRRHLISG